MTHSAHIAKAPQTIAASQALSMSVFYLTDLCKFVTFELYLIFD